MMYSRLSSCLLVAACLSACGSGSGSNTNTNTNTVNSSSSIAVSSSSASSSFPSGPTEITVDPCLLALPNETDEQAFLQLGGPFDTLQHADGVKMIRRIDSEIRKRMCAEDIAGIGLGIVWQGNLVYVKGYGWAEGFPEALEGSATQVQVRGQRTRFRWASVSKTLTALASVIASQNQTQGDPGSIIAGPQQPSALLDLDQPLSEDPSYRGCDPFSFGSCTFNLPNAFYTNWDGQTTEDTQDWPQPIVSLLPTSRQITPRLLLSNRSGLMHYGQRNPNHPSGSPSEAEKMSSSGFSWAVDHVTGNPLLFEPGDRYNYSSFGFNMMGAVLDERVPGGFWGYIQNKVVSKTHPVPMQYLHPDDLYDPIYSGQPYQTSVYRATGYYRDADSGDILPRNPESDVSWKLPGGGFISTPADMALFAEGLLNNRFISQGASEILWTPQQGIVEGTATPATGYGLGFNIDIRSGEKRVAHNGRQESARTRLVIFPEGQDPSVGKLGIIVMSNSEYADLPAMVDAIELLLRNPLIPEPEDPSSLLVQAGSVSGDDDSFIDGRGLHIVYDDADLDFIPALQFKAPEDHRYNPQYNVNHNQSSPDTDEGRQENPSEQSDPARR